MVGECQLAGCLPGSAHLQAVGLLAGKGRERAGATAPGEGRQLPSHTEVPGTQTGASHSCQRQAAARAIYRKDVCATLDLTVCTVRGKQGIITVFAPETFFKS